MNAKGQLVRLAEQVQRMKAMIDSIETCIPLGHISGDSAQALTTLASSISYTIAQYEAYSRAESGEAEQSGEAERERERIAHMCEQWAKDNFKDPCAIYNNPAEAMYSLAIELRETK